jgi:hypothetical protein
MPITDLQRAFAALSGKAAPYDRLFAYYDGNQPTQYSTNRLREAFSSLNCTFVQNWASVVINAALDRIELKGFDVDQTDSKDVLQALWDANQLGIESDYVHEAALITNEGFIIAWPDETGAVQVFRNDPRLCHIFYAADNPREKEFACKWYRDEGRSRWVLTLYYPDRLDYFATRECKELPTSAGAFEADAEMPSAPNPYDTIPVFRFCTNRRSHNGALADVLTLQDAINKLLADMMVVSEFGAFPQRWIISNAEGLDKTLKNGPNLIWQIPAGDGVGQQVSVGAFQGADLAKYLDAIDKIANSIAIISRTPKHYFYNAGASLSGEALIAMEAPLNKKVGRLEEGFGVIWQELAAFLLKLSGKGDVLASSITPIWEPIQSVQPLTEAMTRKSGIDAGIPLLTLLKREGWPADALAQLEKDLKEAKTQATSEATALLAKVRQDQAQANPPGQMIPQKQPGQPAQFQKKPGGTANGKSMS